MNIDTKRHIDSARQVLVGVVPNPTSQIEQITNALIYKFMDDMDQSAIKVGGKPSFFTGDLDKYSWTRLMDSRVTNQERVNMYSEALIKFSQAKQLPPLFRNIFKSAFLSYRSPEVLGLFLKEINYFDYSHPEELGNAYEYLLSIMGSQGDAGQFRTPRHIIDFMVELVNPTKDDKVLDPACGTGGFLISAYKNILKQHDGKNADGSKNGEKPLTPDQRKKLIENFEGYDIDPGMVRIAQVNMYLHQFKDPKIYNYDTLTMEDRWNDKFDVMLANPPFMSPKGGVSTHSKFSIQSNRSEVLFVDYIMNHLRPKGRAGIIIPEGIIFQSTTAHKKLRENLVKDGLCAVVSLPSGVFNPYAGVKTSILIFDNEVAKQKKEILFLKIENDGFDLGAQRRPINKNDLPEAVEIFNKWKLDKKIESKIATYVERKKILENEDFNLSGDNYRIAVDYSNAKWPIVEMGEIADFVRGPFGSSIKRSVCVPKSINTYKVYEQGNIIQNDFNRGEYYITEKQFKQLSRFELKPGDIVITCAGTLGKIAITPQFIERGIINSVLMRIRPNVSRVLGEYFAYILKSPQIQGGISDRAIGVALKNMFATSELKKFKIPIPPLEIQEQIVDELDGYQKIIKGSKQIFENWKPKIDIDPKWKKVKLKEIGKISMCKRIFKEETSVSGEIPFYKIGTFGKEPDAFIKKEIFDDYKKRFSYPKKGDILISTSGTIGRIVVFDGRPAYFQDSNIVWIENNEKLILNRYLNLLFQGINWTTVKGGTIERLYNKLIEETIISIPPLEIQEKIIDKIEKEKELVESSKKLIEIYEQKTKEVISKLWEE